MTSSAEIVITGQLSADAQYRSVDSRQLSSKILQKKNDFPERAGDTCTFAVISVLTNAAFQ